MDYFTSSPHHWTGEWPDSCPHPSPVTNGYMQYASESQAPVLDTASQHRRDRQLSADDERCTQSYDYAMHGPPTTWSAGPSSTEPARLEPVSALELYYDYRQPAYSPGTPPYYARHSALYIDTQVSESPLFPSSTNSSPVTPLHTDEAFARMQRQSSGYIPSISAALDAPICRRESAVTALPGAHQSSTIISRPSPLLTTARKSRKAPATRPKAEPDSPVLSPSPEPSCSTKPTESAAATPTKSKSPYLYTQFHLRDDKAGSPAESAEQSEASSTEPSTPPLKINSEVIQLPKRGGSRTRRAQHLACFFCRRRKIACVAPDTEDPDRTCNQCERRGLDCSFPAESHRGLRYKARDGGRKSASTVEDK